MKPIAWIVGGFALSGLAAVLESMGDLGTNPSARLPLYLPALLILLGGQYCLWRGFRSGIVALWSGAFDRRPKAPGSDTPRSAYRSANADPADGFDADAVIARYLKERETAPDYVTEEPGTRAVTKAPRPTFGRRAV